MVGLTQPTWHKVGGMPWWASARAGGEAEGDGGGLLANTGLNRGNSPEGAHDHSLGPCWP